MDREMGERYPERNIIYNTIALNLENYIFLTFLGSVVSMYYYCITERQRRRVEEKKKI